MSRKMWKISALIIHILLLGSIFVIYFRSPIISGLNPQKSVHVQPPSKRIVLIVTDGLRAESFFKNQCADIPYISRIILEQGIIGISKTHVPTESRPGHIALLAGFYEDPSAVTRGWRENPIDFDSVFNRSARTYAWGAKDILSIFSKITSDNRIKIDSYDHDLDFSGKDKTYELDNWVFDKVKEFLKSESDSLQHEEKVIFFLHLLGLDSAGHIHKPGSKLFLENLHNTDKAIFEVFLEFEKAFPDNRTAYVLTSDHGMTNSGSHGSGNLHETETPLFVWGAGVNNWPSMQKQNQPLKTTIVKDVIIPMHELEQAQITPLLSALIGQPPPVNNFGILPKGFLNVTQEYLAQMVYINALQLLTQFEALLKDFEIGIFSAYMPLYSDLNRDVIDNFRLQVEKNFMTREYDKTIENSYNIMQLALSGIDYYHTYYKNVLLFSTTLTFFGWMAYLVKLLLNPDTKFFNHNLIHTKLTCCLLLIAFVLSLITFLQKIPFIISFYIILPVFVWILPLQGTVKSYTDSKSVNFFQRNFINLLFLIIGSELIVASFFYRPLISLVFILFSGFDGYEIILKQHFKCLVWMVLVLSLTIFPLLPGIVIGETNNVLLFCGAFITLSRCIVSKSKIHLSSKIISSIAICNGVICILMHNNQERISIISQIISWSFLVYSLIAPLLSSKTFSKRRIEFILHNWGCLYSLLCTSFEPIFIILLTSQLILTCSMQERTNAYGSPHRKFLFATNTDLSDSFRLAFVILLYTFFSFFGTGNIASISSFDPNIIRCFLTTFSPFIIMALVILKLTLPIVLILSIIFGMNTSADGQQLSERRIFICLMFICDFMGLNFLYLVKNHGSWLEIGSSISHFVIMEVTTVILVILTYITKTLLRHRLGDMDSLIDSRLPHTITKFH